MAYVLWRIAKEKVAATFSKIRRGGRLRSAIVPVRLSIPDNGLEEWENGQRANSCCYRSHSGLLNTVTSNKRQVSSLTMNSLPANLAGRDVTMLRNTSRAYSQSHELCLEEWENEQRANSCCYRSHSAIIWGLSRIYRSDASRRVESGLSPVSNRQVTSRGDIYGARKVGQGFSLAHLRVPWQVSSKINGSKVQCITTR